MHVDIIGYIPVALTLKVITFLRLLSHSSGIWHKVDIIKLVLDLLSALSIQRPYTAQGPLTYPSYTHKRAALLLSFNLSTLVHVHQHAYLGRRTLFLSDCCVRFRTWIFLWRERWVDVYPTILNQVQRAVPSPLSLLEEWRFVRVIPLKCSSPFL